MSEEKLRSEEVPGKFTEWLLAMGCPADIVPSHDKMTEMCRGQYHLVWRSLMERVDDRSVIREKRMQVFCDDVRRCQKKNVFSQHDLQIIVPEQLSLWRQQCDVAKAVKDAKARVTQAQRDLDQLMDKVSNKMSERVLARERVQNLSRREWLLRQVAADLTNKKSDLHEARSEADSLCPFKDEDEADLAQIDKCVTAYSRELSLSPSDGEGAVELAREVARGGGGAGLRVLLERRAGLVQELNKLTNEQHKGHGPRPAAVLARSAALHCTLMLEAAKNKLHLQHARNKLLLAVNQLKANYHLSPESCELLVLRCEQSHATARVQALRALLDEVTASSGPFTADRGNAPPLQAKPTQAVDKDIENKKEELKRLISLLHSTERKLQSARHCLQLVLAAYSGDGAQTHYREIQLDLPSESIPLLREWYSHRRERRRRRVDISMELEASDQSLGDVVDVNNLTFADELRIYLKKFNLEKNRQFVLESGEKVWACETVRASRRRLLDSCLRDDNRHTSALCPATTLTYSVHGLVEAARALAELRGAARLQRASLTVPDIDITPQSEEEQQIVDKTKKILRESVLELQKTNKIFVAAEEDLKFWSNNTIKKYISPARKYDGMAYRDYEMYYTENCLHV